MDLNFTNENDPWEYNFDIDDSDLNLTPVLRSSSSARVEPSPYTPNPVRIIPGPTGTVQVSSSTCFEPSSSTPNPVRIIPGPAGAAMVLANVSVFTPKQSEHYVNITKKNVVKVFRKDTVSLA
ncbi:transposase, MuDR, MULE transposase domain protein [Tanacetum coccineum]